MNKAQVISRQLVFDGKLVKVHVDRVIEPSGHETTREIVEHPGAVCIVARPSPDRVILIRQYRHATGEVLLEIPAGGLHDSEDPREAAIRELEEETGYRALAAVEHARFWTAPGFVTEFMYLYEATGLTKTQINPDDDEVIEVEIVDKGEALRMIENGQIRDAKTILGLLMVLR
jgi:ADP-ribose pyrophosphatase